MEYLKSRRKKKKRLSLKNYKIIKDFSVVTEKNCIDADKYNNKIYRNALTDIDNAIKLSDKLFSENRVPEAFELLLATYKVPEKKKKHLWNKFVSVKEIDMHNFKIEKLFYKKPMKFFIEYENALKWVKRRVIAQSC